MSNSFFFSKMSDAETETESLFNFQLESIDDVAVLWKLVQDNHRRIQMLEADYARIVSDFAMIIRPPKKEHAQEKNSLRGVRKRTHLPDPIRKIFVHSYDANPYPDGNEVDRLACIGGVRSKQVRDFFTNRRKRDSSVGL
jgi:hypothetical protein